MSGGRSSTGWRSTARCRRSHPRQSHCENPMVMPTRPGEPIPSHAHLPISGRVGGSSEAWRLITTRWETLHRPLRTIVVRRPGGSGRPKATSSACHDGGCRWARTARPPFHGPRRAVHTAALRRGSDGPGSPIPGLGRWPVSRSHRRFGRAGGSGQPACPGIQSS